MCRRRKVSRLPLDGPNSTDELTEYLTMMDSITNREKSNSTMLTVASGFWAMLLTR